MGQRTRIFLVVILLSPLVCAAAFQTPQPTQGKASTSPPPIWTEAERKATLAKAQHGDRGAQKWLGAAYEQGWLGKRNFHQALKWFRRAAAQGDPDAQASLGQMYEDGVGVRQNYSLAARGYRMSAEHIPDLGGAGQGRNNLGLLYLDGLGVPKNYVQAYMWFRLANSTESLSFAESRMNATEVLEAERMATEWKSGHPDR
jgi:hypothetical protein